MRRPRSALVAAGLACALVCAPAPARADVSGAAIVGFLNAQRADNGIPAGIVEDPELSSGCAQHNAYGARNEELTHGEDPLKPGYTPEGDQAAKTSVLYSGGGPWTATHNPFETAPIHLHQLLAPRIDRLGASENDGYGCATTQASRNREAPPADVTYTYPGDRATRWPAAQTAQESPYTPGERVGLPKDARTGPYLYVMFDGPDVTPFETATATSATLTGPDGPVDVAVADNETPGLEGYLPVGMEVIPRKPLKSMTKYTARVSASVTTQRSGGPPRAFAHTWSFITASKTDKPYKLVVAKKVKHGRPIPLRIRAEQAFSLRFTARTAYGRVLARQPVKRLAPGRDWTYAVKVPGRYRVKGRKIVFVVLLRIGGEDYAVRRAARFR